MKYSSLSARHSSPSIAIASRKQWFIAAEPERNWDNADHQDVRVFVV
jgi:hypothetical protein